MHSTTHNSIDIMLQLHIELITPEFSTGPPLSIECHALDLNFRRFNNGHLVDFLHSFV